MWIKLFSIVFILLIFVSSKIYSQTITISTNDCGDAYFIKDSILTNTISPSGPGSIKEITNYKYKNPFLFEKEHNTIWYKFTTSFNGKLCFDIVPVADVDDYDFILYRSTGSEFCEKMNNGKAESLRACISRNDKSLKSKTGLSLNAGALKITQGVHPSYAKYIDVKKDEEYYLLVDNVYENGKGHKILFHNYPEKEKKKKLEKGVSLRFSNIRFYGNEANLLPESEPALDSLLGIMTSNPNLKVEIQGHVNDPENMSAPGWNQTLSDDRSKAVYDFLVKNGIDKARMQWKGYSNSKMIYPHANSEKEYKYNRRVEILVLEN